MTRHIYNVKSNIQMPLIPRHVSDQGITKLINTGDDATPSTIFDHLRTNMAGEVCQVSDTEYFEGTALNSKSQTRWWTTVRTEHILVIRSCIRIKGQALLELKWLKTHSTFSTDRQKAVLLLQVSFECALVVSYVAFVLWSFAPYRFFC